eukprot:CAMPEP_0116127578 /NCGR_PEP_ID=MMETSP0329-20121206/6912_1 /TAXON_ID=697910 /ORGANISM="Pseudo-nitzschia arenysensis, Strain B593" /LENGTH=179 /DNA_ID=CAMNT_0003621681 /DNA_START=93 /DNA_END=633 /DNA_ORIENTATION=-
MPTSILNKTFTRGPSGSNIGIFIRLVILPHLLPKEGDFIGTFRLFLFLDFIQVALIASQFIRFCFAALGFDKYRDNIEILRVGQAECPNCKKVCLMETYKVFEGIQQEKFGDIEYAWEDWRTRVHCTACCHTYSCDDDDDEKNMRNFAEGLAMVPSEKVRHRPMAKDSLREPLLPVEVV